MAASSSNAVAHTGDTASSDENTPPSVNAGRSAQTLAHSDRQLLGLGLDGGKHTAASLPPSKDGANGRDTARQQRIRRVKEKLADARETALGHLTMDAKLAVREARHNSCQYCIGCSAVFIVVVLVSILMTILIYSPVVFLTLAENSAGQLDLVLSVPANDGSQRLNYTSVATNLEDYGHLSAPRISSLGLSLFSASSCIGYDASTVTSDVDYTYDGLPTVDSFGNFTRTICQQSSASGCLGALCAKTADALLFALNTDMERSIGIGRSWTFPPVPDGSIYLHQNLARTIGVNVGDYVYLTFDWTQALPVTYAGLDNSTTKSTSGRPVNEVSIPLRIDRVLPMTFGKLDYTQTTAAFIELESLPKLIAEYLPKSLPNSVRDSYSATANDGQAVYSEATDVIVSCSDYRVDCYMDSQYKVVSKNVVDWASNAVYHAGFTSTSSALPVLTALNATQFFSAFLNLIFTMVVVLLSALSCFLIYSLLMVSVETKTFELGIFRMVGMSKSGVVSLISVQALSYSIPAWALGLSCAQILWVYLRSLLSKSMNIDVAPLLAADSILLATALGVLVPLLASVIPIRQALTGNLHDALDTRRPASKAVIVTIERNEGGHISSGVLTVGAVLTIFGFSIYYFLPLALLSSNITLLFNIFLILLMGMMFGLVMLSLNVEPLVERLLVKFSFLVIWFENRSMILLVIKNLVAHRRRNRKTSIMYALSLGFIIFLTVAIRIELESLIFTSKRLFASDIQIQGRSFQDNRGVPLGVQNVQLYENYLANNVHVKSWSYTSFPIELLNPTGKASSLQNIGRIAKSKSDVKATGPGFFDDTKPDYIVPSTIDTSLPADMTFSEHLYTIKGSFSAIIGGLFHKTLNLQDFTDKFVHTVSISADSVTQTLYTVLEPLHFVNSLPYYIASEFPSTTEQDAVISMPQYLEFAARTSPYIRSVRDVPINIIFVYLMPKTAASDVQDIMLDLTKLASIEIIAYVGDEISGISSASASLGWIFQAITIMAMVVAFFSLNSSMYTNIVEQKKEMGVLRALGLRKAAIFRLFSYEAFVLIFSAAILGTMIGTSVGWTMATQRSIITQVPLQFLFPWDIVLLVFAVSIGCSLLSTVGPIYQLVARRNIVSLLK